MTPEPITIIGDGSMATVCALLLQSKGHPVTLWGPFADHIAEIIQTRVNRRYLPGYHIPDAVSLTADEKACFGQATLIVNAIPTQFIRPVWTRLAKYVPAGGARGFRCQRN